MSHQVDFATGTLLLQNKMAVAKRDIAGGGGCFWMLVEVGRWERAMVTSGSIVTISGTICGFKILWAPPSSPQKMCIHR